ncbi:MAG: hypothetical protein K0S61_2121 [Anaerocolumna sp.]|jgi:ABC-2 type transport system permease protein|nr:hypothetical protein [Anaerocolumna sp.]
MNIYRYELKSLLKSTLIWSGSMIFLSFIYFSVYGSISEDIMDFKSLLEGYPESVRAMLGVSLDNIASILGFYSMILTFVVLCGGIQGMIYGTSILSKENREKTADFLLVKPVSRTAIVTSKICAALSMLIFTSIIYYVGVFIIANIVKTTDYSNKMFFMMNLTVLLIQVIFFAIGLFVSVLIPRLKSVLPISLGIVFGLYILGAVIAKDKEDVTRYISPFRYVNYSDLLNTGKYEIRYFITAIIIILVSIIASYFIYIKRDIHAV